jgi:alpha-beta hydrolase superfamily lysophospholipase
MEFKEEAFQYLSADGSTSIHALCWKDADPARRHVGVVQIIHGAAEHVGRYRELAEFLAGHGFIVCGEDHIGHGQTALHGASGAAGLSHMPVKGGADILIADVDKLRQMVTERHPALPCHMLGHSMGSYILRVYLSRHAQGLDGAIISGTGQQKPSLSAFAHRAAVILAALRGETHRSKMLDSMGIGSLNKSLDKPRTTVDWLSYDEGNVDAYLADELCGNMFSVGAYATLADLMSRCVMPQTVLGMAEANRELRALFISGRDDPVGDFGTGVELAADSFKAAGMKDVELQLYEGMRHEILNETGKRKLFAEILDWLGRAGEAG